MNALTKPSLRTSSFSKIKLRPAAEALIPPSLKRAVAASEGLKNLAVRATNNYFATGNPVPSFRDGTSNPIPVVRLDGLGVRSLAKLRIPVATELKRLGDAHLSGNDALPTDLFAPAVKALRLRGYEPKFYVSDGTVTTYLHKWTPNPLVTLEEQKVRLMMTLKRIS